MNQLLTNNHLSINNAACLACRGSNRSRLDQAQATPGSKLQPTSVMAAAAAALNAGGALGKAAAKAVGIPINARSGSGNNALCNGDYSDTALPTQHIGHPQPAMAGAGCPAAASNWQTGQLGAVVNTHALHGTSNDTSLSGIDCTPRQHSLAAGATAMQADLSTAAPLVMSGMSAGGSANNGGMSGYAAYAMETDAPGINCKQGPCVGGMKHYATGMLATGVQPGPVSQPHDAGQSAMVAAIQSGMAASAATPSYILGGDLPWMEQQQKQPGQPAPQAAGMPQSAAVANKSQGYAGQDYVAANSSQQHFNAFQRQEPASHIAVIGQGLGPGGAPLNQQHCYDQFGCLPRLNR